MIDAQTRRRAGAQRVAAVLGLLCVCTSARLHAQALAFVRFDVASVAAVDSVRRLGIDVVEAHAPDARGRVALAAVITPADRAVLAARGWIANDVARAPALAALEARRAALGAAAYTVYRDFDDPVRGIAAYLRSFAATRGNVFIDSIGASSQGRPLLAVKIGAATDDPGRPNVLFLATYHAREWAATEIARRLIEYFADSLAQQPGGAALLASRDVWVIPVANPDGYEYTFTTDRLWRKNRSVVGAGATGVDLNRNHTTAWGLDNTGSSPTPASETYRGPSAESEAETRAIALFHQAHPPVVALSWHTYTGAVLYPWSQTEGALTGDDPIFRALAGTDVAPSIRDSVGGSVNAYYHPGPAWHLYPTNGDYVNWAYATFGTLAFTVEASAGCCVNGAFYGFEFPDSEPMLARLFQDNLPFALGLLRAAGNPSQSVIPPGATAAGPQLESVWPEVHALLTTTSGAAVEIATDSGIVRVQPTTPDTFGAGRTFVRLDVATPAVLDARAVRITSDGLVEEIIARDGAELPSSPWKGFNRIPSGYSGAWSWSGYDDTLTSPAIAVTGRSALSLFFWTRHAGSVFDQSSRGIVQVSADNGAWMTVGDVVGSANRWYPVRMPLDAAAGAGSLRVRFVAQHMGWLLDAIAVGSGDALGNRLFIPALHQAAAGIDVSANPVTLSSVTLHWTAVPGTAHVEVFSMTGVAVTVVDLPNDPGRWLWDLTTIDGRRVANGAYYIVLTLGDNSRLRRRLLVAR